ncbi:MAG TPA: GTP cyclohydrolase II [Acetobacteraceae bacterium]|nr:GTP cyclohydrolase II [Acetobacteraceae bacterium]
MTLFSPGAPGAAPLASMAAPAIGPMRAVHRAAAELRRGAPVLLEGSAPLVVLAAETVGERGLAEFAELTEGTPVLLVAPVRAAAILHRPVPPDPAVALELPGPLLTVPSVQALADPTLPQERPSAPTPAAAPEAAPAALMLVKLSRLLPAVLAAPARPDAARTLARLGLLSVPAADAAAYPGAGVAGLTRVTEALVPLDDANETRIVAFRTDDGGVEHLAIVLGDPHSLEAPLVRLHSECFTGDLLGSLRCDCGAQLRGAIRRMAQEHAGVLLYLAQEGRGIGLVNKLRAYALQDRGLDTLDANRALGWGADERSFMVAAMMLEALGLHRVRLLTNNPHKIAALAACGIAVAGRVPHAFAPNGVNDRYLATKARRFGHLLD